MTTYGRHPHGWRGLKLESKFLPSVAEIVATRMGGVDGNEPIAAGLGMPDGVATRMGGVDGNKKVASPPGEK